MTPKEKAEELVNKCYSLITGMEVTFISKLIVMPKGDSNYETAKECALIAVDEIIKVLWHTHKNEIEFRYWQEVKQEIDIEKL